MAVPHAPLIVATAVTAIVVLALCSAGQNLSPDEVQISGRPYQLQLEALRAETRLVHVEVVVRDNRGSAIGGLTGSDFAVLDSGRRRDLVQFSVTTLVTPATHFGPKAGGASAAGGQPVASQRLSPSGRFVALFFDDVNTPPGDLARAKIAAKRFIREATETDDRIGLFTTSGGQILEFTSEVDSILKSMMAVQSHLRVNPAGLKACPRITPYEAYQIVKRDATTIQAKVLELGSCDGATPDPDLARMNPSNLLDPLSDLYKSTISYIVSLAQATWFQTRLATQTTLESVRTAVTQLASMPGKRVLLFASSGFLSGDLGAEQDKITNEALRAGVVINSLDSKGLYAEAPGRPLNETPVTLPNLTMLYEARSLGDRLESEDSAMANFAESTGGLLFRNNNDLDFGFRELGLVPAYAYELGFLPDEDGKYHKIKVELKNPHHEFIQARHGYFAPTKEASEPIAEEDHIEAEVRGSDERSDFPLSVSQTLAAGSNSRHELGVQAHVDIRKMPFERREGRNVDMLTFVAALFDAQGKMITGKEAQMRLALKPESFERFSKSGINGTMSLEAPAGAYHLRVVVQEVLHGEMSATSQNVQIP